ncbi:protein MIX23 [Ixodes scapularis]|uniref:protein MIX23 n=1 Tax=Ixodes scapularis TaxID=6945 RepID=UPI001125213F|nr:protein MIX23 [Ixodes scapularis]
MGDTQPGNPADKMAASGTADHATVAPCDDFMAFQEVIKKLRRVDDHIIHTLNTTLPTESFAKHHDAPTLCKDLYEQLRRAYAQRDDAIKQCLQQSKDKLNRLQQQRSSQDDDPDIRRKLRKEQSTLRLLQGELNVEEVVRQRSLKVYQERCRLFYVPPGV